MLLKIKQIRTIKKINQDNLALKTGLSKRMIIDYEREIKDIPLQKLQLIARALNVSIFDLIELDDNDKPKQEEPLNELIAAKNEIIQLLKEDVKRLKDEVATLKGVEKSRTA